ncbi:hypothetical protein [Halomonas korlensis]|nr:hypothetical protein [Halomonas korlensis]
MSLGNVNGTEFADHAAVAKAVTPAIYFCDHYCSGQRESKQMAALSTLIA